MTPEQLREMAARVNDLRIELLCDVDDTGTDPEASAFVQLALNSLDNAQAFLDLATLKQRRAV
jgi:hypothetical protein